MAAKHRTLLAPVGFLSKELLRSVLQAAGDRCSSVRAAVRRVLLRVPVEDAAQLKAAWQVGAVEFTLKVCGPWVYMADIRFRAVV